VTDPLEFLRAAHAEAEARAEAATAGPWTAFEYVDHDCGFEATIGTGPGVHDRTSVVGHGYEGGGVERMVDAVHIAANDPAAVLRRITAERKLIGLYEAARAEYPADLHAYDWESDTGKARTGALEETVMALAEGWGWTEETT
jgi:hypothetical protein